MPGSLELGDLKFNETHEDGERLEDAGDGALYPFHSRFRAQRMRSREAQIFDVWKGERTVFARLSFPNND